ncbi:DUF6264 family protein [Microbacterium fluvii]|uniref:DUF6264 family protein n=1 Tax=Microbacterium fluvii TaxID=415215 RepID=A0ABW2HBI7_9MICO|nr:DUF6264 family protein [Microbacterium fluvii]MCU4672315.1 DUF6264 family protein [Microbacterium fluvii]
MTDAATPAPDEHPASGAPSRPRYGEYATPEEQRARIRQPDVTAAYDAGHAVPAPTTAPSPNGVGHDPQAAPAAATRQHPVDRVVTTGLLGFGFVNVLFSAFGYLDLAAVIQNAWEIIGIDGSFTNTASAQLWGPIAAGVLVIGYLATAFISFRVMRSGRIAWWIPLVGAVVSFIGVYACLLVPLLSDPGFIDYVLAGA